jgi:NhaC family Na+:H+ antiporter
VTGVTSALAAIVTLLAIGATGTWNMAATSARHGDRINDVAGDQDVADVRPSRIYRTEFAKRGLAPRMLSRPSRTQAW